jgi:hypothetical protein
MIKHNLFEYYKLDSFQEINVLESVNKLCFEQNSKKVGKFSFFNFLRDFKIWENILSQIFLIKFEGLMHFPRICLF